MQQPMRLRTRRIWKDELQMKRLLIYRDIFVRAFMKLIGDRQDFRVAAKVRTTSHGGSKQ